MVGGVWPSGIDGLASGVFDKVKYLLSQGLFLPRLGCDFLTMEESTTPRAS